MQLLSKITAIAANAVHIAFFFHADGDAHSLPVLVYVEGCLRHCQKGGQHQKPRGSPIRIGRQDAMLENDVPPLGVNTVKVILFV